MAKAAGPSPSAISRIRRAFALRPHRADTFKLSTDPDVVEEPRDVVGLYLPRRRRPLDLHHERPPGG